MKNFSSIPVKLCLLGQKTIGTWGVYTTCTVVNSPAEQDSAS